MFDISFNSLIKDTSLNVIHLCQIAIEKYFF